MKQKQIVHEKHERHEIKPKYNASYKDIFELLRLKSSRPEIDIPAMGRQMVFNALIGNTEIKKYRVPDEEIKRLE